MIEQSILHQMYIIEEKGTSEIGKLLNKKRATVLYWLRKYNIPLKQSNKLGNNLTNKKHFSIKWLRPTINSNNSGERIWQCQCDCGNLILLPSSYFKKQKSCGCLSRLQGNKSIKWKGYNEISGSLWNKIKNQALKRGLVFNVSIEYCWDLFIKQNKQCALSGQEIEINYKSRHITASLDRIDNDKGYVTDNVQWVHRKVNFMKQNMKEEEFFHFCKLIVKYNKLGEL